MKALIHYVKGNKLSEEMAQESLASYIKYGWDVELIEGYTPKTLPSMITDYTILNNSRLNSIESSNTFQIKLAIIMNQVRFWKRVVEENQPLTFVEHDSICVSSYKEVDFGDMLLLNLDSTSIEYQIKNIYSRWELFEYMFEDKQIGVNDLPDDWPWIYEFENVYKYSKLPPGVSSYTLKPNGARKLLNAIEQYGIEQGDMTINSFNIDIKYINPKLSTYHQKSNQLKSLDKDYHNE